MEWKLSRCHVMSGRYVMPGHYNKEFTLNSYFQIPLYLQPDGLNIIYFKLCLLDPIVFISLKYLRSLTPGWKEFELSS